VGFAAPDSRTGASTGGDSVVADRVAASSEAWLVLGAGEAAGDAWLAARVIVSPADDLLTPDSGTAGGDTAV